MISKWLLLVFSVFILTSVGCRKALPVENVEILQGQVILHSVGGSNYVLKCVLDIHHVTHNGFTKMIYSGPGSPSTTYSMSGDGMSHIEIFLDGTFVNDGRKEHLLNIKKSAHVHIGKLTFEKSKEHQIITYKTVEGADAAFLLEYVKKTQQ